MNDFPPFRRTSFAAILSLVFGLIAWTFLPFAGALVAVICGHVARAEIRRSAGSVDGGGLAVAGLILGWLQLLLLALAALTVFGILGYTFGAFGGHWLQPAQQSMPARGSWI